MPDAKERFTKEELIEKINNERRTFREAMRYKDREKYEALEEIQKVTDMIVARFVRSFGEEKEPGTWTIDIPMPSCPEGKKWVNQVVVPNRDTYRIRTWLKEVSDGEEKDGDPDQGDGDAGELHAVPDAAK